MELPKSGAIEAFALISDLNGFTSMVANADQWNGPVEELVRNILSDSVGAIEEHDGEVVSLMGDAVLGILPSIDSVFHSCMAIAKRLDKVCEFISDHQRKFPNDWGYLPGGPSMKIAVEFGTLLIAEMQTRALGKQRLFIGNAINYASRISKAGNGNRCVLGPQAAELIGAHYIGVSEPASVEGKTGEPSYIWHDFDLGEVWRAGERVPGESYWG